MRTPGLAIDNSVTLAGVNPLLGAHVNESRARTSWDKFFLYRDQTKIAKSQIVLSYFMQWNPACVDLGEALEKEDNSYRCHVGIGGGMFCVVA